MEAKRVAQELSLDKNMTVGSIIVKNRTLLGIGANGSDYHKTNKCERVLRGIPTGQGYDLCEGCHPKNHSEAKAIANARRLNEDLQGASIYTWGHWWCCEECWKKMIEVGIQDVYLMTGSDVLFNKGHPDNIVGKQYG